MKLVVPVTPLTGDVLVPLVGLVGLVGLASRTAVKPPSGALWSRVGLVEPPPVPGSVEAPPPVGSDAEHEVGLVQGSTFTQTGLVKAIRRTHWGISRRRLRTFWISGVAVATP